MIKVIKFLSAGILLLLLTACLPKKNVQITVSAASNLIPAFEEMADSFKTETGIEVIYNFGSSGKLAQQITAGAPVDVFAAANTDYVSQLIDANLVDAASAKIYAYGRLTVWGNRAEGIPAKLEDLTDSKFERIAIANPNYAPYGVIAKAVLQSANLWDTLQPRFIFANDVRQTLTYAQTGDVTVALVPLSLVINLDEGGYFLVPAQWHQPLAQSIGVVKSTAYPKEAQQFIDFVLSEKGQLILKNYGYESANEEG